MGYLRSTKRIFSLRPIVSNQGSVSYGVAKELARILKPLSGNNNHQVLNSKEFADDIKKMKLEEESASCHMMWLPSLYLSQYKPAIEVVKEETGTGYRAPPENHHVHPKHPGLVRDLLT